MSRQPPQSTPGEKHDWVSGQQARCRDELVKLNRQYRDRTGDDYYLYTSRPGDGQTRVVFTDGVVHGYAACLRHMQAKIALEDSTRRIMKRPDNAGHLPAPSREDAMAMAGVLFHFTGGSTELRERLARWMEHHEGDLDEQIILWYLTGCLDGLTAGMAVQRLKTAEQEERS